MTAAPAIQAARAGALGDADAVAGDELLAAVAGSEADALARRVAVGMFTPACLAAGRLNAGIAWLREAGFEVVHMARIVLDERHVDRVWKHQAAGFTPERWRVAVRMFSAGPSVVAVVTGSDDAEPAAARFKELQGPSDPERLRPEHLRARLGAVNKINNLVHAPQDVDATVRELPILLGAAGARSAWTAALAQRPLADAELAVRTLGAAPRDDAVCVALTAARLRSRALVAAEAAAGPLAPALRRVLGAELEWALDQPWGGWRMLEAWRERFGPAPLGPPLAARMTVPAALVAAMTGLDAVLADREVDLAALEANLQTAGLAPSPWESLAVATQAVAQEVRRCA
jgi:hypothetical protein